MENASKVRMYKKSRTKKTASFTVFSTFAVFIHPYLVFQDWFMICQTEVTSLACALMET